MYAERAPYGREANRRQERLGFDGNGRDRSPAYTGPTYYDLPVVKPSFYGWLVILYLFIGGLASAAQFIATAVDLVGGKRDRPLVRSGRYIALAGALVSPFLLIADLHSPQRWYNMLRIFRRTSPMSIGSWALVTFGVFSGFAAVGQIADDLFDWPVARAFARLTGLPAALAGGVVSLYTGTLLAATSVPLWASAFPFLSSLFASSAASTAAAALSLASDVSGAPAHTRKQLSRFAVITGLSELGFALLVERRWQRLGTGGPMQQNPIASAWRGGVLGLGIIIPLIVHLAEVVRGREMRGASRLAAVSMLIGGFILRAVFVFGGKASAGRPRDYFHLTEPSIQKQL